MRRVTHSPCVSCRSSENCAEPRRTTAVEVRAPGLSEARIRRGGARTAVKMGEAGNDVRRVERSRLSCRWLDEEPRAPSLGGWRSDRSVAHVRGSASAATRVGWVAPASCPTEAEVASAVEVWLGEPLSTPRPQELAIEAVVSGEKPFVVRLHVTTERRDRRALARARKPASRGRVRRRAPGRHAGQRRARRRCRRAAWLLVGPDDGPGAPLPRRDRSAGREILRRSRNFAGAPALRCDPRRANRVGVSARLVALAHRRASSCCCEFFRSSK